VLEMDEESSKAVDFLPATPLKISYLRGFQKKSSIEEIWIPRFTTRDDIDANENEVWDLAFGVVPTSGIETFLLKWQGQLAVFELGPKGWQVKESFEKADIHPQVFAEVIKPYVGIERVIREKQFMERE
jgi:hypothetical protein